MQATEYDEYLSGNTMRWCSDVLTSSLHHVEAPQTIEFIDDDGPRVPNWYKNFVYVVRAHFSEGNTAKLALAPRSYVDINSDLILGIYQLYNIDPEATGLLVDDLEEER